jgi:hypothetical protein
MSRPGPRITVTFGYGGASPKATAKLGSVSMDQESIIGSETFRGPLPAGRKSLLFRNDGDSQATLTFYSGADGTGFLYLRKAPPMKTIMIPIGAEVNFMYTAGGGQGRALVLQ